MTAIERVAECWRRLYFRNFKWATVEHADVHERLMKAQPRVGAGMPCRGCSTEIDGLVIFLGNGLVCESCLIHSLAHLATENGNPEQRDLVLDLLLGEKGADGH